MSPSNGHLTPDTAAKSANYPFDRVTEPSPGKTVIDKNPC